MDELLWELPPDARPIGYRFLTEKYDIQCLPHPTWSYVGTEWRAGERTVDGVKLRFFRPDRIYPKNPLEHLEFALRHEGLNLHIVKEAFRKLGTKQVSDHIRQSPTGKYTRKIWFLYEFLLEERLPLDDVGRGSYVPLLEPEDYYTGAAKRSPRHRVIDNLLGDARFCPVVRRTDRLLEFEQADMGDQLKEVMGRYDPALLGRAVRYLYSKETMASWEIERERPEKGKGARFIALLERAGNIGPLSKKIFIDLQNSIVDPRFGLEDYRSFQNYIGEEIGPRQMIVHFIAPRPEDVPSLMEGLISSTERMLRSDIHPVIVAAILSFGFVFIHPFWDGNGRLHRFLIHYVLSKTRFTPDGVIFPVSSVILQDQSAYDAMLESISRPLLGCISDYSLSSSGEMSVRGSTSDLYGYLDYTHFAEYLFTCIERTLSEEFEQELQHLEQRDQLKHAITSIVDLPDQQMELLIRCLYQNGGKLSARKRKDYFSMLTDEEVQLIEQIPLR